MYFGIDLGTTYSIIGSGETVYTGLVSSSVDTRKRKQVDRSTIGEDIVSSYKVNMSTSDTGKLPIECSAIILQELARQASEVSGYDVKDVVISVPAKFNHSQRDAVYQAGSKAGLNVKGLINEPTAAAIYMCQNVKDLVVVYDLGGGTFDVTILDSRVGTYSVVATDGRLIAGDNFDEAICKFIMSKVKIPIRLKTKENVSKLFVEIRKAKETLQRTRMNVFIDLSYFEYTRSIFELTVEDYVSIMKSVFKETVDLTKYVISTSLGQYEKPKIIFVGGSTACPYLRDWVCECTGLESISADIAPDFIVAKGVALYAEMLEKGTAYEKVEDVTTTLSIADKNGCALTIIEKNSIIPAEGTILVSNDRDTDTLEIDLYQGDSLLVANNSYIGTLIYEYDSFKKANEGYVTITCSVNYNGMIKLSCTDIITGIASEVSLKIK